MTVIPFSDNNSLPVPKIFKFENPIPVETSATIDATESQQCFYLKAIHENHGLLLLKMKSDSGSGSVFSKIFCSGSGAGSERKTKGAAGIDSGSVTTSDVNPSGLAH